MRMNYDKNTYSYFIPAKQTGVEKIIGTSKVLTGDLAEDANAKANKRIGYFEFYIRRVAENLRNIEYAFSFKPGRRIAKLNDDTIDTTGVKFYHPMDPSKPLTMVRNGRFALEKNMFNSGDVNFERNGQWHHEMYTVCEWELTDITPVNVPDDEIDKVLGVILRARAYHLPGAIIDKTQGKSVAENEIEKFYADGENHTVYVSGGFPSSSRLFAFNYDYTIQMQKNALNTLVSYRQPHHAPLIKLFEDTDALHWKNIQLPEIKNYEFLNAHEGEAQDIQRLAVKKALGTKDYLVIQGPPGSGKTTVLLETIVQAIKDGARVLLTASTHVAVDNILERLEEKKCFTRYGINPIRIGDEEHVNPKVSRYCLKELAESERRRLLEYYGNIEKEKRTHAQDEMEKILKSKAALESLEDLLVNSANLVCGTTIGILQAPMIQALRHDKISKPLFDIMILDEASKTTFTEFLVPALYCRKFIISGDTKQLTPYTEEKDLEKCISSFFASPIEKEVCKAVFDQVLSIQRNRGKTEYREGKLIICSPQEISLGSTFLKNQVSWFKNERFIQDEIQTCVIQDSRISKVDQEYISASNILLVTTEAVKSILPYLPLWYNVEGLEKIVGDNPLLKKHTEERALMNVNPHFSSNREESWEKAVAWRMCRKFELHQNPDNSNYRRYVREINHLTPKKKVHSVGNKDINLEDMLEKIETVAFSSILELLESGFSKKTEKGRFVIADSLKSIGKDQQVWNDRHVLLKYQWRMHPDIAQFSCEEFYGGDALLSHPSMVELRQFAFNPVPRTVWIDTSAAPQSKDRNEFEATKVLEKLSTFIEWAQLHPKESDEKWTIAILSFYAAQKELLVKMFREKLQEHFGFFGKYSHFKSDKIDLVIATVDRFQGQEADVVYLSFVRNYTGVGFLDSANRVNVAITRAKYQLYMFGSLKTLGSDSEFVPNWLRKLSKSTPGEKTEINYGGSK